MVSLDSDYWTQRYKNNQVGWDIGYVSTPLKDYIDQLTDKSLRILIPGGGNSYEAEYLWNKGFKNVFVVDISKEPLNNLKSRLTEIPDDQLIHADFFQIEGAFDLVLEQTFFCALAPKLRPRYVLKMHSILRLNGKLVGLLFDLPLKTDGPPFGGGEEEYRALFQTKFQIDIMDRAYNSIQPRSGNEFFLKLMKK
ncbi:MAG: methyltransferase domain-containing protein [Roseivirga sp.]